MGGRPSELFGDPVGMSRVEHVQANERLVGVPPATLEQFSKLFERGEGA